jgi:Protein of unknown function (DUF1353)
LGGGRFLKEVKNFAVVIVAASLVACASHKDPSWTAGAKEEHPWGYYSAPPIARWEPDGRNMTLISELRYTDPNGMVWIAPAGSVVDGASIPRSLWSIMGGPFEGKYRNASILHDVAYDEHNRPWQDCDRMFYNAMRCSGVNSVEAKTMYYALHKFGRHWKVSIKKAKRAKPSELAAQKPKAEIPRALPVNESEINETRDWIRNADPSLEEIEARADAESQ